MTDGPPIVSPGPTSLHEAIVLLREKQTAMKLELENIGGALEVLSKLSAEQMGRSPHVHFEVSDRNIKHEGTHLREARKPDKAKATGPAVRTAVSVPHRATRRRRSSSSSS